jgi:hypothetical protein
MVRLTTPSAAAKKGDDPQQISQVLTWGDARGVTEDAWARALLESRGLDPVLVEELDLARAVPRDTQARTTPRHCLVLPTFDHEGCMRNLRAWYGRPGERTNRAGGLVLADGLARQVFELGAAPAWWDDGPLRIVIVEGEPDFLVWATHFGSSDRLEYAPGIIGIFSGAWTAEIAARIPHGTKVSVRTHHDKSGDESARRIKETLAGRAFCFRPSRGPRSEAHGRE